MRLTPEEMADRILRLETDLTSLQRQLGMDLSTKLIGPIGDGSLPCSMRGPLRLSTFGKAVWAQDVVIRRTRAYLDTASGSGSVVFRLNVGASDYDLTLAASATSGTASWTISVAAGTVVTPEVTSIGAGAVTMTAYIDWELA